MKYGIVLDNVLPDTLPERWTVLSIPAGMLPHGAWPENFPKTEMRIITDPADAALFRIMPEENLRVRLAFQQKLEQRVLELAALPADLAVLAPDMERMKEDPVFAENVLAMLRSLAAVLTGSRLHIAVTLRMPAPESAHSVKFLMELLQSVPGLRAALEIHPHEPAFAAWDPELLRPLRMLAPVLQIVYDRASGNRLTEKLLAPVRKVFDGLPYEPVMLFRPGSLEPAAFTAELAELEKLL